MTEEEFVNIWLTHPAAINQSKAIRYDMAKQLLSRGYVTSAYGKKRVYAVYDRKFNYDCIDYLYRISRKIGLAVTSRDLYPEISQNSRLPNHCGVADLATLQYVEKVGVDRGIALYSITSVGVAVMRRVIQPPRNFLVFNYDGYAVNMGESIDTVDIQSAWGIQPSKGVLFTKRHLARFYPPF
jgi:hypothetical protein